MNKDEERDYRMDFNYNYEEYIEFKKQYENHSQQTKPSNSIKTTEQPKESNGNQSSSLVSSDKTADTHTMVKVNFDSKLQELIDRFALEIY